MFDTLIVFLKDFFLKQLILKNVSRRQQKHEKLDLPIIINQMSLFQCLELLESIIHFIEFLIKYSVSKP